MRHRLVFIIVLICITITSIALAEDQPRMAVMRFTNNTNAYWWKPGAGAELSEMLATELRNTKKFKMIERREVDSVISEVKFNQSGLVDKATKIKLGKIKGAQYLVMATVTSFEEGADEKGGGLSFMGIGVGGKSSKAYIAVDLKVVDAETSEIVDSRTIEGTSESTSSAFSGGFMGIGASGDKKKKAPVGKAIRACVVNIAEYLECSMVDKSSECLEKYAANEMKRKDKTKSVLDLDE